MKSLFLTPAKSGFLICFLIGLSSMLWNCTTTKPLDFNQLTPINAKIVRTGLLDIYPAGLKADSINYVYAEASAAMKMGDQLLIAIDKPTPASASPVFTVPISEVLKGPAHKTYRINFIKLDPFSKVLKLEAFAKSPNDSIFFATTAFDRIRGSVADWDAYNALLTWQVADFSDVQYIAGTERNAITSSRDLRNSIQRALPTSQFPDGAPYFKIEALVVLPGNRLIFGVRELGESYLKFDYTFTLLETTFTKSRMGVQIDPNFKKIYEFQPVVNNRKMGISDLVYHAATNSLLALTSYEEGVDEKAKVFFSSLWILPLSRLEKGEAPMPVSSRGKQLEMPYKAEGITLLDDRTLFIIFDEDRKDTEVRIDKEMLKKQPNQAIFSIVKIK